MSVIKNKKQYKHKKMLLIVAGGIAGALLIGGVVFAITRNDASDTNKPKDGPSEQEIKQDNDANNETKQNFIENPPSTSNPDSTTPSQNTVQLTAKQETDGSVTIISKLYGVSYGTCNLTVTNGAQTTTKTAQVIYQPEFSSCAGFSLPLATLGVGSWNIKVAITGGNISAESSATLEVK